MYRLQRRFTDVTHTADNTGQYMRQHHIDNNTRHTQKHLYLTALSNLGEIQNQPITQAQICSVTCHPWDSDPWHPYSETCKERRAGPLVTRPRRSLSDRTRKKACLAHVRPSHSNNSSPKPPGSESFPKSDKSKNTEQAIWHLERSCSPVSPPRTGLKVTLTFSFKCPGPWPRNPDPDFDF